MTNEEPTTTEPTPADATPEQEAHSEANNPRLAKVSEEAKRYRLRVRELEKQLETITGERDASTASVQELREQASETAKRHDEQVQAMRMDIMASVLGATDAARKMDKTALAELSDRLGGVLAADPELQQAFTAAFDVESTSGRLEQLGRLASQIIETELEAHPYMQTRERLNPLRRTPTGGIDPTRPTTSNPIAKALADKMRR